MLFSYFMRRIKIAFGSGVWLLCVAKESGFSHFDIISLISNVWDVCRTNPVIGDDYFACNFSFLCPI